MSNIGRGSLPQVWDPLQAISDQGREFDNKLLKGICKVMRTDKIRTSPYKASVNGAVEPLHRTLNAMLRSVVSEAQKGQQA